MLEGWAKNLSAPYEILIGLSAEQRQSMLPVAGVPRDRILSVLHLEADMLCF